MEKIEERRLQRMGGSCLISIPASWLHQYNLKQGDTVELYLHRGDLVVSRGKDTRPGGHT